jgi:SAM-dependent methyltransferase
MRLPPDNVRTGIRWDVAAAIRRPDCIRHKRARPKSYPNPINVETFDQKILLPYLTQLPQTLAKLKPVAKSVARDNTIVVLVCNFGQSELLVNFICNARAKGFDLSQVLVFTTDLETQKIVEAFGVATFYDEVVRLPCVTYTCMFLLVS